MTDFARTHIVTAGYLRRFADEKLIQPVRKGAAVTDRPLPAKHPSKVGIRTDFYVDSELAAKAEKALNRYETRGLEALRRVQSGWPLERGSGYLDRLAIAGLVAVHMVRNPAFRHHLDRLERPTSSGPFKRAPSARRQRRDSSRTSAPRSSKSTTC